MRFKLLPLIVALGALHLHACGAGAGSQNPLSTQASPTSPAEGQSQAPTEAYWPKLDQNQSLRFDRFSLEEGLSQSVAQALLQDSQGFLWVGTEDGLNRFDGLHFTVFRSDPEDPDALSDNHIRALAEDLQGNLWVGTYGGGLNRYDPRTGRFERFRHDPQDPTSLSDDQILALYVDREGSLWIGTRGGGLNRFESATQSFTRYRHDPADPGSLSHDVVRAITQDGYGTVWIGTNRGLNRFSPESGSFTRYMHDSRNPSSLIANPVLALLVDLQGDLWVGTAGGGLDHFRLAIGDFAHYEPLLADPWSLSSPIVTAILEDPAGGIWVGTDNGLNYFDRATDRFYRYRHDPLDHHSLSRDQIEALHLDSSGGLWLGTYGGGLNRFDPRRAQFALYQAHPDHPASLAASAIWGIYEDSAGELWIGTDGGGLDRLNRATGEWQHYRHDPQDSHSLGSDVVMDIFEDDQSRIWVGTDGGGLNLLDRRTGKFDRYLYSPWDTRTLSSNTVWFIRADRQGRLWVGTPSGLNQFDPETGAFTRYLHDSDDPHSLADDNVGSFYADQSGTLWVGTHDAFHRFDPNTGRFQRYQHDPSDSNSISHNIVFAIHEGQAGNLWLGTWGGGLNRFDPASGRFEHYRVRDGLPNDVVYGILQDDRGNLWMSTNRGISCFDPRTETFHNYGVEDGLQSSEFSYNAFFQSPSGEMFFGGIGGFNAFYPEIVSQVSPPPPILLTSISVEGETIDLFPGFESADPVRIRWPDAGFEFEYAALSFYRPEESQYAYRLDGFDDDWNEVGTRRFGRYTSLPGGDYTLRIRGSNSDGVWNEAGLSLALSVVPPFWATWWFRVLAAALIAAASVGVFRLRLRRMEVQSRELEQQIQDRTRSLEERTKDLERRQKELEALYRADEELLSRLDLDAVLQALVDTAVEILEADKGGLLVWDERSEELVIRASKGFAPETLEKMRFAPGQGVAGRVFQSGQPIAVEDASTDPRVTPAVIGPEGIGAFLQVPITIGSETYGVFSADYLLPRRFDQATRQLLISLASHAALAIDNARLYQEQKRRAEQFKVLNAVGSHVTTIMAIDELLNELVKLICETFGYYLVEIGLVEDGELVYRAGEGGTWGEQGFESFRLGLGEDGITGRVAATGQAIVVRDTREDPRYLKVAATDTLSELAVPIKTKEHVIGVINIESNECCAFDESDMAVFQSLADQAAIAIENARLYEAQRRRAEQFHLLLHSGSRITSLLTEDELREQISQLVKDTLGYFQVSIGLIEGDTVVFRWGAGTFWKQMEREPVRLKIGGNSLSSQVAQTGEYYLARNVREDPLYYYLPGDHETQSELLIPLKIKEQVIGVLAVSSDQLDAFDLSDVAVLQTVADQVSVAIENARLYTQAQELAVVEERARLARDLHDAVTQTLFSASLIAEALPNIWQEDQLEGHDLLRELRQLNRGALAEMRNLLMELRPAALMEADFGDLMRQLGDSTTGRIGYPVKVTTVGDSRLPDNVHIALYRIVQESLNNVVKHSGATEVQVSYSVGAGSDGKKLHAKLLVRDNGRGFDEGRVPLDRLGLGIIHERAESVGATLEVHSQPDQGTEVRVVWEETAG